jgi:hypothetical protein
MASELDLGGYFPRKPPKMKTQAMLGTAGGGQEHRSYGTLRLLLFVSVNLFMLRETGAATENATQDTFGEVIQAHFDRWGHDNVPEAS